MTPEQLYLFDSMGYLLLRSLLTTDEIAEARRALQDLTPTPCEFANTTRYEALAQKNPLFEALANDSRLVDNVRNVINQPMRLIESYSFCRSGPSSLYLHNGLSEELRYDNLLATRNMGINHSYHDGRLYCTYVKAICYLTDVSQDEDGPFCYVEGSHKASFALLAHRARQGSYAPLIDTKFPGLRTVPVDAGDVLILNEALMHGTLRKTSGRDREFIAFSYAPAFVSNYSEFQSSTSVVRPTGHYEAVEEPLAKRAGYPV